MILAAVFSAAVLRAQAPAAANPPSTPPHSGEIYPLKGVQRGLRATAWTIFSGDTPEPMDVEVLGVLRGARGPGEDIILIQLHGAKPEYTGVVAGMSGSPVYVGNRLLGALAFRIGQFSKDPIAGVTPIEQMLEVRDLPTESALAEQDRGTETEGARSPATALGTRFEAIETPLVMTGFSPEAVNLWQKQMTGTGLDVVAPGGVGSSSNGAEAAKATTLVPGSAVSAQLVRGDLEIAATCTVTYVDAKQLLACGHPLMQAGSIALPMTATDVVATLASPMNSFKIVNTGATVGAFTDDRASAIRGIFGAKARMIPVHIAVHGPTGDKRINFEMLDQQSITAQALLVSLFNSLTQTNLGNEESSYHLTGNINVEGYPPSPLDLWAAAGEASPAALQLALMTGDRFGRIFSNSSRRGAIRSVDLKVEAISQRVRIDLESARLVSRDIVHAGDTVMVEVTLQPWQMPRRNVRIPVLIPADLAPGNLRLLVSDASTLDRTLDQPRPFAQTPGIDAVLAQAKSTHPADRIYVSLLIPETQAGVYGQTLTSLPLSVANSLETQRNTQEITLNGESARVAANIPAGGVPAGMQVLNVHIEPGGGLH